jgi:hypothetical protein
MDKDKKEEVKNKDKYEDLADKLKSGNIGAALGALGVGLSLLPTTGKCDLTINVHIGDNVVYNNGSQPS